MEPRIGISGWTYGAWRGNFYPPGLPQRLELAYAGRRFNSLEINGTFYSLQRPETFRAWDAATPPGFVFAVKGGRYITHLRRLKDVRRPLANFCASGLLALGEKLGPILWQFPPFMPFKEDRFGAFFELLPRDTAAMARLAREHAPFLKGRVALEAGGLRPVRHAVEFRHESFMSDRFVELLRHHGVAMVVADTARRHPVAEDVTGDLVYARLHGARRMYVSGYTAREIERWAARVRAWSGGGEPEDARRIAGPAAPAPAGREVYVFFDNTDIKLRAPVDARRLAETLGVAPAATVGQVLAELGVAGQRPGREATSRSLDRSGVRSRRVEAKAGARRSRQCSCYSRSSSSSSRKS